MIFSWSATGKYTQALFWAFGAVLLATLGLAIYRQNIYFLVFPLALVLLGLILTNYHVLYYLLLIALPFSVEIDLPGGFGTDLFSEPLIIVLAACCLGTWLLGNLPDQLFLRHPLIRLILLVFLWALVISIFSVDLFKSGKYLLAKSWYLIVFVFLTGTILKSPAVIAHLFYFFIGALAVAVTIVLIRHGLAGFNFESANFVTQPFFRNHVMYGVVAAATLPYAVYLFGRQSDGSHQRWWWALVMLLLLAAVIFSYTRASWLSLPLALLYGVLVRFRLTRYLLLFSLVGALAATFYLSAQYRYLQYAPDYEKTIFNRGDLARHLQATYQLRDVSGMERIYRWIAAGRMFAARPLTGSGPQTFYPEYQKYTISQFATYVSDNPEKSTVHNYFLLQFAEQGIVGGVLFLLLMGYALLLPEKIYHRTQNSEFKQIALAAGLCLFVIAFHLLLNELVETDKIGALFYISMAILVRLDNWTGRNLADN